MPPDLHHLLAHLALGPIEYHESVGSTNDLGTERLAAGAPDLTLILADEQTAGRGRLARHWHTRPGSALAFTLVLRPAPDQPLWAHAPLSALAVHDALAGDFSLPAAIKWPNDVLIGGKKVCGILAEAHWQGDRLEGVVLGTGINVLPESVPPGDLNFPATSVAGELARAADQMGQAAAPGLPRRAGDDWPSYGDPARPGAGPTAELTHAARVAEELAHAAEGAAPVDRWALLARILRALLERRTQMDLPDFVRAWERRLAFRGERVTVGEHVGTLVGLAPGGALRLETAEGIVEIPAGEVSLRPL